MPQQPPGASTGSLCPVTRPCHWKHLSQGLCRQGQGRIWALKAVPAGTATPRLRKDWQLPRSISVSSGAAKLFHTDRNNCTAPPNTQGSPCAAAAQEEHPPHSSSSSSSPARARSGTFTSGSFSAGSAGHRLQLPALREGQESSAGMWSERRCPLRTGHSGLSRTQPQRRRRWWDTACSGTGRGPKLQSASLTKGYKSYSLFSVTGKHWFNWIWPNDTSITYIVQAPLINYIK